MPVGSTITNTVTQTVTLGVVSSYPTYASPLTITSTGTVNVGAGDAVYGPAGGYLTNAGLIQSSTTGVDISGFGATVVNTGTIAATTVGNNSNTIILHQGGSISNLGVITNAGHGIGDFAIQIGSGYPTNIVNGQSGSTAGLISAYHIAIITGTAGSPSTVSNFGTIETTGTYEAIQLREDGSVFNGASGATTALITGLGGGVVITGGYGTVVNFGTIHDTGSVGSGVYLGLGGTVSNNGMISGAAAGVDIGHANGTVINLGTITGNNPTAFPATGVSLYRGSITNGATAATGALIYGVQYGAEIVNTGTVRNFGTIAAGATTGTALRLNNGGSVNNSGTVIGGAGVYLAAAGTVTNSGTILSTNTAFSSAAVHLSAGGTVSNLGTASLIKGQSLGVYICGTLGTVTNAGKIIGVLDRGVAIYDGGKLTNSGTIAGYDQGIYIGGTLGTVINSGTVTGSADDGVVLYAGGVVTNTGKIAGNNAHGVYISGGAGSVSNRGTITGTGTNGNGVTLFAGSVTNGATNATGAVISGRYFGVQIQTGTGGVVNFGSITSSIDTGVWLNSGTIVNGPSGATHAVISGYFDGVFVRNGRGTVHNYGTVVGSNTDDGVCLYAGGLLTNGLKGATTALIRGVASGVDFQTGIGTVVNSGTISAPVAGGIGIELQLGGTVTDSGTILGGSGAAIIFGGTAANRLILQPGYHFGGKVFGSTNIGATNTLELGSAAGTGTLSAVIANEFIHFGTVKVDAGAHWVLSSNNTIAAGQTLSVAGTLVDLGTLTNAGVINGSGDLIIDPATLINSGSIGTTVKLVGGSVLINQTGGMITQTTAFGSGVFGSGGAATVVNQGQITAPASIGVQLTSGGRVTNQSSGLITGGYSAVNIMGSAGTVVNYGTVSQTGITGGSAIYLGAGGNVVNRGTVTAVASTGTNGSHGIGLRGAGTITNLGRISVGGTHGDGIKINNGGLLLNRGTVVGASSAVQLRGAGSVINGQTGTSGGVLVGYFAGVAALIDASTLVNFGSIVNFGTIESTSFATSYNGFSLGAIIGGAGSIVNAGLISGSAAGIVLGGPTGGGIVTNAGRIIGSSGTGVELVAGGRLTNQSTGTITGGGGGAYIEGGAGTLLNSGTIAAANGFTDGVFLNAGGVVTNSGLVSGLDGVDLRNTGTVTNSGRIIGGGSGNVGGVFLGFNYTAGAFRVNNTGSIISSAAGVLMRGAGTITNGSNAATGATISGSIGVQIAGAGVGTVVNFGTITGTGGIAIGLGTGNDRVVIEKGSVLKGAVAGFHIGDTFDLPFMSFSGGTATLKPGNVLRLVENGGTFNINLNPAQNFTGDFFHLGSDGSGGTLVTENLTPPAPYSISPNPAKVLDNAGHLILTITRTNTSGPAVVYASVEQDQGFANNGDYTFFNGMEVNFAAGVASVNVSVGIIDTGAASGSEVFRFIVQQHKTDPISTFLASDKFTITNTTAPAAAMARFTFADIAPAGLNSGAANSGSPSTYLPGPIAANEQAYAGGQLLFATGHSGGTLLSLAGGANHDSLPPA